MEDDSETRALALAALLLAHARVADRTRCKDCGGRFAEGLLSQGALWVVDENGELEKNGEWCSEREDWRGVPLGHQMGWVDQANLQDAIDLVTSLALRHLDMFEAEQDTFLRLRGDWKGSQVELLEASLALNQE